MANELTINLSGNFIKGSSKESVPTTSLSVTVTGSAVTRQNKLIATAGTPLDMGDITTAGYCFIHNLDTANYVDVGNDGSNYVVRCKATEWAVFRSVGTAVHAKANTAACQIEAWMFQS